MTKGVADRKAMGFKEGGMWRKRAVQKKKRAAMPVYSSC